MTIPIVIEGSAKLQMAMPPKSSVPPLASRQFTAADTDTIDLAIGACNLDAGNITIAWIWRVRSTHAGGLIYASQNAGNTLQQYGINPFSDGFYWFANDAGSVQQRAYEVDVWCLDAVTNLVAVDDDCHHYSYDTGVWTHTDKGAGRPASVGSAIKIHVGQFDNNAVQHLDADVAVIGIWDRVLSDTELETLPPNLTAWSNLSPVGLWAFNQQSVSNAITDLTGNGADQTARDGTTVVFGQLPAGFRY